MNIRSDVFRMRFKMILHMLLYAIEVIALKYLIRMSFIVKEIEVTNRHINVLFLGS